MTKNIPTIDAAAAKAKTENENWQKFKSDSDKKINQSENRVDEFKKQAGRIKHKLKPGYHEKIAQLQSKTLVLKQKMQEFIDDRTERQEKFTKDFNSGLKGVV